MASRESTYLRPRGEACEEIVDGAPGSPRPDNQQQASGVQDTRLDQHGDDGIAQSTDSIYPHSGANASGMQEEPDGNHEGEENVE